ncbi:glycosyltransferase family 1 protein [Pseudomonas sp. gcc21]|uniref:glycosyltransferase family 1 protein n=1 Tax=Pseudomonas sp. gcc21 TaxID=2726989 RepID=UPI001451814A|nr:glycosyltransferase family 1 protein [Pseudomonas sp. gcc21]QJD58229.1 glycosyltransferase family 1 protein [Pseudomonas sp. gcc21]
MSWAGPFQTNIGKSRNPSLAAAGLAFSNHLPTLLVMSHLRWNFVYQRPQHLMCRFTRDFNVLFFEEPLLSDNAQPWLEVRLEEQGVRVLIPHLPQGCIAEKAEQLQRELLEDFLYRLGVEEPVLWFYTPMALNITDGLRPCLTIYDCMDELSAFRGAPLEMIELEHELLRRADLVFTGGFSLWEAKRELHCNVHAFPSSVDIAHFSSARHIQTDPFDQANIPHPRLGFYGVIDERLDIDLVTKIADLRPQWHIVLVGPVVKIDPASLPQRSNLYYLGAKTYEELPEYLAGWDVAIMPFALNESTRFISPTKTPEFLAGGCPVVSTPIKDVVRTYGDTDVVYIGDTPDRFVESVQDALRSASDHAKFCDAADAVLGDMSWDNTWELMMGKIRCEI